MVLWQIVPLSWRNIIEHFVLPLQGVALCSMNTDLLLSYELQWLIISRGRTFRSCGILKWMLVFFFFATNQILTWNCRGVKQGVGSWAKMAATDNASSNTIFMMDSLKKAPGFTGALHTRKGRGLCLRPDTLISRIKGAWSKPRVGASHVGEWIDTTTLLITSCTGTRGEPLAL